jgi:hypothetical protein
MPFIENLPDNNRKLFTVLLQTLEAWRTDFQWLKTPDQTGGARPPGVL